METKASCVKTGSYLCVSKDDLRGFFAVFWLILCRGGNHRRPRTPKPLPAHVTAWHSKVAKPAHLLALGSTCKSTGSPCRHSYARAPRRALVVPKLAWVLHRAAPLVCMGWREKPGRCWHRVTCVGLSRAIYSHQSPTNLSYNTSISYAKPI